MKATLFQYYVSFKSLHGAIAGVPFLPVIISFFVPDSIKASEYLFPPLGDAQAIASALTLITLLVVTYAVYVSCYYARKSHPSTPFLLLAGVGVGAIALIGLYIPFVRVIDIPSAGLRIPVSIGNEPTDFATRTYPHWSDRSMLHDRGPSEETVQRLWTYRSIWEARAMLWLAYTFTLSCFLAVVCIGVYRYASESGHGSQF
jgi:hypothetical protein